jgi:cytochrome c553
MLLNLSVAPKLVARRFALWTFLISLAGFGLSGCRLGAADAVLRGKELFETCVPCHGPDGAGSSEFGAPNIAGMKAWYIEAQLQKFRAGARGAHFNDQEGMRMRPMALSLSTDENVQLVAKYVESLPPITHAPVLKGDIQTGDTKFHQVCAACHGPNGGGNDDLKAPRLAGVDDWYLAAQLRKFKTGVRGADPKDTGGRLMRPMARSLADEDAIRNVVAYVGTLKP